MCYRHKQIILGLEFFPLIKYFLPIIYYSNNIFMLGTEQYTLHQFSFLFGLFGSLWTRSKCGYHNDDAALDFSMISSCDVTIICCQWKSITWMSFSNHITACGISAVCGQTCNCMHSWTRMMYLLPLLSLYGYVFSFQFQ